jgi:hypothetical protein
VPSLHVIASPAKQTHWLRVDSAEESDGAQDKLREASALYYNTGRIASAPLRLACPEFTEGLRMPRNDIYFMA